VNAIGGYLKLEGVHTMPEPDESREIQVFIIEDQREIREGLATLINGTIGFRCRGTSRSMEDALSRVASERPDVVLLDLGLPGISGIEGIPRLLERHPPLLILVLTVFEDDDRIFRALCAGACGYLLKRTAPAKLLESIREVKNGGAPISPEIARRVVQLFREFAPPPAPAGCQHSAQEQRVLQLLVEGHNYKTAAAELGITTNTISFHTRQIFQKLQVHSKSEAVAKALRNRIVH
jgi:DNA-binding NarL/FixJ family response regulator